MGEALQLLLVIPLLIIYMLYRIVQFIMIMILLTSPIWVIGLVIWLITS